LQIDLTLESKTRVGSLSVGPEARG
jgi:hypothetical protein